MNDIYFGVYSAELETRELDGMGVIEGRPIVFNREADLGFFREIIAPEALVKTDLKDVRLCLNHDTNYVYARSRNNNENSTMQLFVDDAGLRFVAKLAINESPKAKDFYSAIKRKDMDKMSFMFRVRGEEWEGLETESPLRRITDISEVVEISMVTFPAYDSTEIQARSKEALESARQALESAREQRAEPLDSGKELELAKAKTLILGG